MYPLLFESFIFMNLHACNEWALVCNIIFFRKCPSYWADLLLFFLKFFLHAEWLSVVPTDPSWSWSSLTITRTSLRGLPEHSGVFRPDTHGGGAHRRRPPAPPTEATAGPLHSWEEIRNSGSGEPPFLVYDVCLWLRGEVIDDLFWGYRNIEMSK